MPTAIGGASFASCLIAATCALAIRIALFDWQIIGAQIIPNHDMLQGAGFFAVNLHSIRLSGEIAWWKANALNGYAHYYQAFLSPLAPTPSHLAFYAAISVMSLLDLFHLKVSEYALYLGVTYIVLPWCAFLAFGWLTSLLTKRALAIFFACSVYALSTVGLWEGAWFYFQEPATFTFLLAATIAFIQEPSRRRIALLLTAILIQSASLNYWTVYNLFFAAFAIGGYVCFFPGKTGEALKALWSFPRLATVSVICIAALWMGLFGSMALEQSRQYVRPHAGVEGFQPKDAVKRIDYYPPQRALAGMIFRNTAWEAPDAEVPHNNPMHRARYIGLAAGLLATLALFPPSRIVGWLLLVAAATTWTSFAPAPLVWLWTHIPPMSSVQHVFYFYPHFLAQILILLAAVGLNRLLNGGRGGRIAAFSLVAISTADMSSYFAGVSRLDQAFTEKYLWGQWSPMTAERRATLLSPMRPLSSAEGFEGGASMSLPIITMVFPLNHFLLRTELFKLTNNQTAVEAATKGPPIMFTSASGVPTRLDFEACTWTYNRFCFVLTAPADGDLLIRQVPDPLWRISVDGASAAFRPNSDGLTIRLPIARGRHEIIMDYRPFARPFYWPATALLWLMLAVLLALALPVLRSRAKPAFSHRS